MEMSTEQARAWMQQWRAASHALAEQRRIELRQLTDEAALAAAEALLSMADSRDVPEHRRSSSGLVDMQALLHRARRT